MSNLGIAGFERFHEYYNVTLPLSIEPNAQFGECTIERINVNGNYEPSNCCFIPLSEQPKNRRNSKKNQIAKEMLEWEK